MCVKKDEMKHENKYNDMIPYIYENAVLVY